MEKDSKFTRDENGYIAIRTVSAPYSSGTDDKDSMFTRDEDGYVAVRTISGGGGGSGDQHNLGYYATPTALREAYPTAEAGDWAIVGSTDTVWIWDTDNSAWVDSDQKGQVTSVNNQTGDVTITAADVLPSQTGQSGKFLTTDGTDASWATVDALPSQTGNAGKVLTTDGTDASWSDKPLVNTNPTASTTVIIGNNNGSVSSVGKNAVCLTHMGSYGGWIALGNNAIAIGNTKNSLGAYSINIGGSSCAGNYAIQLGGNGINSDANTFKVGNANGNFEIMSADGTIPEARLADTTSATAGQALRLDSNGNAVWENITTSPATAPTLVAANWSSNTQTITVQGVTATNTVIVSPIPTDAEDYAAAGILCTGQAPNALTFTCQTVPASDLQVNIVIL